MKEGIGEFLSERIPKLLPGPNANQVGEAEPYPLVVKSDSVQPAKAEQLFALLADFASGPDFAKGVDDAVPPPRPDESEEEFVTRAKEAIFCVLMATFRR